MRSTIHSDAIIADLNGPQAFWKPFSIAFWKFIRYSKQHAKQGEQSRNYPQFRPSQGMYRSRIRVR
ncbi:MAG: hypothetical protein WA667_20745 [Candidatus Nitrosopolaris sp.]